MSKTGIETAATPELSEEDKSKDAFFIQLAGITEAMIARHGKEFAMGALILSARFVAENRSLIKQKHGAATVMLQPHQHKTDCSCC